METINRRIGKVSLVLAVAALVPAVAIAHGDVTPQAVDVSTLKPVGDDWLATNPYRGNAEAVRIGSSAYNQNCARCHGLEAISAASPRSALPPGRGWGDEIFLNRIRHGSTRGGRVMPPFEGILQQEAMWAIRAYLETVHEE